MDRRWTAMSKFGRSCLFWKSLLCLFWRRDYTSSTCWKQRVQDDLKQHGACRTTPPVFTGRQVVKPVVRRFPPRPAHSGGVNDGHRQVLERRRHHAVHDDHALCGDGGGARMRGRHDERRRVPQQLHRLLQALAPYDGRGRCEHGAVPQVVDEELRPLHVGRHRLRTHRMFRSSSQRRCMRTSAYKAAYLVPRCEGCCVVHDDNVGPRHFFFTQRLVEVWSAGVLHKFRKQQQQQQRYEDTLLHHNSARWRTCGDPMP